MAHAPHLERFQPFPPRLHLVFIPTASSFIITRSTAFISLRSSDPPHRSSFLLLLMPGCVLRHRLSPSLNCFDDYMGRSYNLDLCLLPTGSAGGTALYSNVSSSPPQQLCKSRSEIRPLENSQQITIFYNGRVCACDVTEFQARAILSMAKQKTEERLGTLSSEPSSGCTSQNPQAQRTGLSMKRSLQRFLQKRKSRIQATCPYTQ